MLPTVSHDAPRSRVLTAFVVTGLGFMLFPGTLFGVWNLIEVRTRESVALVSPEWLQAHGHAQIFGWIGSFILGIGFYSVQASRSATRGVVRAAWLSWLLWTSGVAGRWIANVYGWHWQSLLPLSACAELAAFLVFFSVVSRHRPAQPSDTRHQPWIRVVMSASLGFFLTVAANAWLCVLVASHGHSPAFPHAADQRFLMLASWGFLAPFVWGFSLKWLPVFLGLRPSRLRLIPLLIGFNTTGVLLALTGWIDISTVLFVISALAALLALRIFEPAVKPAKTRGVHRSFPVFVRLAYVWLVVSACLGLAAASWDISGGIWGASRHAFTVGFISTMVFAIGQRVLPEFAGLRPLWSPRLMFAALLLLQAGCFLRVSSEILAYQQYATWAWPVLPISAVTELLAVAGFAINLWMTLVVAPERQVVPARVV
jgi:hypothetical protein